MNQEIHNKIAQLSLTRFQNLPKTGKPKQNEWTVLSCIVKEQNENFEVVSLGTGSKCLGKNKMSLKGTILNDSHAEVICRRSFMRYLYQQMCPNSSIFDFEANISKFQWKPFVKFHFFTSHVPCGDAAIFPKKEFDDIGDILQNESAEVEETPKKRRKEDINRTGAKCLTTDVKQDAKESGCNYHVLGVVRTKPGRGDPTLSVSCSDKLAKWCHLGIQGALLSILLKEPIYLSSVTVAGGTPFCQEALERALYGRIETVSMSNTSLLPAIGQADQSFSFYKVEGKMPCSSSISWILMDNKGALEVAVNGIRQGMTKKSLRKSDGRLKICKLEFLKQFLTVVRTFHINLAINKNLGMLKYQEVKTLATNYQKDWAILKKHFKIWTLKDEMYHQFCE